MATVNVRNLPDAVHRALRVRAAHHGRSTEAEIRFILEEATRPAERVKLGSLLASIARDAGGLTDEANQSGWLEVEWLYAPHVLLDGRSPAECFTADPERVLAVAREEFGQDRVSQY